MFRVFVQHQACNWHRSVGLFLVLTWIQGVVPGLLIAQAVPQTPPAATPGPAPAGHATPLVIHNRQIVLFRTSGLRKEPPPFVLQTALSDLYVEYQLNAYLDRPEAWVPTLPALHANVQAVFNEYGAQILPPPHYRADPPEKVWVPKAQWYCRPREAPSGLLGGGRIVRGSTRSLTRAGNWVVRRPPAPG